MSNLQQNPFIIDVCLSLKWCSNCQKIGSVQNSTQLALLILYSSENIQMSKQSKAVFINLFYQESDTPLYNRQSLEITPTDCLKGVTGNVWWYNECIVEKFCWIHLRHMKGFYGVYLKRLSAKSMLKIMNLGGYVLGFFKNY